MCEQIEGFVSSIVFSNADNGYTVLRVDTAEGLVTACGTIPGVAPGERLRVTGSFVTHPQFGEQLKAESFEVLPPSGKEEAFRYLASGSVKHIGPGRARDIVDRFGSDALHIIETDPDRLAEIRGISLRAARKIGAEYSRQAGLRRLIAFVGKYNIRPLVAARVYKDYGDDALEAVKANPYILTSELYGASFADADAAALDLGFESDCPMRISAAIVFTLTHNLGNGHTFIPRDKLTDAVCSLVGVDRSGVSDALDAAGEAGDVVCEAVAGVDACYLRHIYEAEQNVATRLRSGAGKKSKRVLKLDGPLKAVVDGSAGADGDAFFYSDLQLEALRLAAQHDVLVLTGGPGTGKTTTVRAILDIYLSAGLATCLCAPTGRAAKRLSELCRYEAATIHRLLGASRDDDGKNAFEHDELNPLEADALIVDECSMIDIVLMDALLRALKPSCRIVLVGDVDQLPPIGPGNMFSDVIRSGAVPVISLSKIFRQAQGSGIVLCAHSVNSGVMPDLAEKYTDFFFMQRRSEDALAETIADLCSVRLPQNMGLDPSQIQVLSPTRKRGSGTFALNNLLRERLNPKSALKKEKQAGGYTFRTGDKVMQIKNNYDIIATVKEKPAPLRGEAKDGGSDFSHRDARLCAGVFNGDVGTVCDINFEKETLTVDFEDKLVSYSFEQLSELEPAYAITVHKSQGSEYHTVILAMAAAAPMLLTRSVLYTAMTRARSLLIVVGSADVFSKMVQNDKRQKRYSGLRARLAGET